MHLQIIERFHNNVPQNNIVKVLNMSSSLVHNFIKGLSKFGEISEHMFQQINARPHTAAIITAWLRNRKVRTFHQLKTSGTS